MLLYINDSKTVEDLQERFNKCFPYLKLVFYKDGSIHSKDCTKATIIQPKAYIGEIRSRRHSGVLDIKSWDTTSKIKQQLKEVFGLYVQVFRKHRNEWVPAIYSDDITLQQQSELARTYGLLQSQ